MPPLTIRIAEPADLPAIVEIYNQAIALRSATADLDPITVDSRAEWFASHDPAVHPIYVAERDGAVAGWCSLSPHRPGRGALRHTVEISYYIHEEFRRQGIASRLIAHAIADCPRLGIKNLFAILLDINQASVGLLEKAGFERWGHLPRVAEFDGIECGQLYYGRRVEGPKGT
jgi:phosphinothricin acetyltransferase